MKRFQARRRSGRFTRNTMENTLGLHCAVCPNPECRRLNPSRVGEPRPETCHACGGSLVDEKAPEAAPAAAPTDSDYYASPLEEERKHVGGH